MDPISIAAASGLRARMESLDMLANNLANTATAGYKGDREFYGLYISAEARPSSLQGGQAATLPVIERQWTDFSQGTLLATGNPLDLAISGRGFFAVNGPAGPLYTRNGSFQLSATGAVTTLEGYPVRLVGGGALQTASSNPIEVSPEGAVRQDGAVLGQLEIADFRELSSLSKQGSNYFASRSGAAPAAATGFEVRQGRLESSNVASAEGAVRLVNVIRQFEMLQRAITLGGEMNRRAVEEVARVGS
ncbi:MAG TPA: flagellar hook basal-body protein [Bryobacteraceae bacterium]|nr:flagellar hook basal-body protein [Bryobacteraceae bacterium]